jgi:hypothetical protein
MALVWYKFGCSEMCQVSTHGHMQFPANRNGCEHLHSILGIHVESLSHNSVYSVRTKTELPCCVHCASSISNCKVESHKDVLDANYQYCKPNVSLAITGSLDPGNHWAALLWLSLWQQ